MKTCSIMIAAAAFAAVSVAMDAGAATVFSSGRGFYRADGSHPGNNNYVVGHANGTVNRNWFTFNLPTPPVGQCVVSAMLQTNGFDVSGNLTVTLYDFTGTISGLTAPSAAGPAGVARFNDLGNGTIYGSRNFIPADTNTVFGYTLNSSALAAINANLGSAFAIGGASSVESSVGIFAYGSSQADFAFNGDVRLILEYGDVNSIPLPPAAWAGLSTLAGLGLIGSVRRRRQVA